MHHFQTGPYDRVGGRVVDGRCGGRGRRGFGRRGRRRRPAAALVVRAAVFVAWRSGLALFAVACTVAVVFRAAALRPTVVVVVIVVVMMVGMHLMQTVGRRVVMVVLYGVLQVVMRRRR